MEFGADGSHCEPGSEKEAGKRESNRKIRHSLPVLRGFFSRVRKSRA